MALSALPRPIRGRDALAPPGPPSRAAARRGTLFGRLLRLPARPEHDRSDQPRPLHFGSYRAVEVIGSGGMSTVFGAVHAVTGAAAAVKVLPLALCSVPELRSRLELEAAVLRRLDHPNVVKVLEVGEVDRHLGGGCYLVEEWLPNSLDRVLEARRPDLLPIGTALWIAHGVALALAAVHAAGLAHRDVKPSNVLVRADGTPVLADFGLAVALEAPADRRRLTPTNVIVGTAAYLSPEQVEGGRVDERSDLYSLGVVLYELLSGEVPFARTSPLATLQAHLEEPPPPLPPRVPDGVRAIVTRALEKRPEDRFPSAASMASALEAALQVRRPAATADWQHLSERNEYRSEVCTRC